MEVKLAPEHKQLIEAVQSALRLSQTGVQSVAPNEPDLGSFATLQSAGFLDVMASGGTAVESVLIVEQAAASAPGAPVAARALVAPLVIDRPLNRGVGLAERRAGSIVRFAAQAESVLVLTRHEA